MSKVSEVTEVVPHACSVQRARLVNKESGPRWVARCTVCGILAKPYETEDVAKRRAVLHAQSWGRQQSEKIVEHSESCL
jgi:hypothetical protein